MFIALEIRSKEKFEYKKLKENCYKIKFKSQHLFHHKHRYKVL